MNTDEKNKYFQELSRNLRHEGLTVKPETEEGLLPVELDGQRLCLALETGAVRYWKEDAADDHRSAALNRVTDVATITAEYMRQMEAAPQLTASGLTGDYRLLAEFNDTVLAGHPSKYGVQFVTWEWVQDHTALYQGNYYGPEGGTDSYAAAKRNFAVRSGLVSRSSILPRSSWQRSTAVTSLADSRLSLVNGTNHRCICGFRSSMWTTAEKIFSAPTSC